MVEASNKPDVAASEREPNERGGNDGIHAAPDAWVVRHRFLTLQVCVPKGWSKERVKEFADLAQPSGTDGWWVTDDARSNGDPAVVPCADRPETHVHRVLDA